MSNISENAEASSKALNINLTDFIVEFGEELMDSIN
ncbi:hypothetical protein ALP68_200129 [Pseudomonas ficuserectae]|nr:hypothetical protein ALP68_200129 [Pseudomonas ficuserectae]